MCNALQFVRGLSSSQQAGTPVIDFGTVDSLALEIATNFKGLLQVTSLRSFYATLSSKDPPVLRSDVSTHVYLFPDTHTHTHTHTHTQT